MSGKTPTPKKPGRKPVLEPTAVAAALARSGGNISAVAARFKVDRSAVRQLIDRHEPLRKVLADARETLLDLAEGKLMEAVKAREPWAVCFFLKTIGKSRGYVERQELTGSNGGPIPVTEVIVRTRAEAAAFLSDDTTALDRPSGGTGTA